MVTKEDLISTGTAVDVYDQDHDNNCYDIVHAVDTKVSKGKLDRYNCKFSLGFINIV